MLFITNRLIRLFPAYWLILLLIILFSIFQHYYSVAAEAIGNNYGLLSAFYIYLPQMNLLTKLYMLLTNLFIIGQDTLLFLGLNLKTGTLFYTSNWQITDPQLHTFLLTPVTWAVSLEILFYIIAPFLLRRKFSLILLIVLLSIVLRVYLASTGLNHDPWTNRFFPTELAFFLFGNISYRIYKRIDFSRFKDTYLWLVFIAFLSLTIVYRSTLLAQSSTFYFALLTIVIPLLFQLTKGWKLDRYIGELSYIIFISHVFLLSVVTYFKLSPIWSSGMAISITSLMFAIVVERLVLRKIEIFRQNRLVRDKSRPKILRA